MSDVAPTLWSCADGALIVLAHHPVSWFNVRSFAASILLCETPECVIVEEGTPQPSPQYELRFEGNDTSPTKPDKRMQVRKPGGEWEDA